MSPIDGAFSAFSFISFVLVCIPFPWHLEASNTGTCLYMGWTALGTLILFINSVVWADNSENWAPVWCDITSRVIIGLSVAIPASSLCINRRLYKIAAIRSGTLSTKAEKHRAMIVDLLIGIGLPVLVMILQYIVQGHRFNIFEGVGCYPFTWNTPLAYVLVMAPPLTIGVISGGYSIMSFIAFRKCHSEFKQVLSSNSNLSQSRYFRLMALAGIDVLACVPLNIMSIIVNCTRAEVFAWVSWEDTHYGFSRIDQFPADVWRSDSTANVALEVTRWLVVIAGLTFFAFFGFADEAQKNYKLMFSSVAKRVGYTSTGTVSTKIGSVSASTGFGKKGGLSSLQSSQGSGMPIYVSQETVEKRDSLDSISDMTSIGDMSDFASSRPTSTFNSLTKAPTVAVHPPQNGRPLSSSFPTSVTPSGSFLDLTETDIPRPGNDLKV